MCKGTKLGGRSRPTLNSTAGTIERFPYEAFSNCIIADRIKPYAFGNYVQTFDTRPKASFLTASPPTSMLGKPTKVIDIKQCDSAFLDFHTNPGSDVMSIQGTTSAEDSEKGTASRSIAVALLKDRDSVESSYQNSQSKQNAGAVPCDHFINLDDKGGDVSAGKAEVKAYGRREGDKETSMKDSYSIKGIADVSKIRDLEWLDLASIGRAQASSKFYKLDVNIAKGNACRSGNNNRIQASSPLTRPGCVKTAAIFHGQLKVVESRRKELELLKQSSKADQKTLAELITDLLLEIENLENEAGKWKSYAERNSAEIMALVCKMYEIEDAGRRKDCQQQLKMQNLEVQLMTFQRQCRCKKSSCTKRLNQFMRSTFKKLFN